MNIDNKQTHPYTNQLIHEKSPYLLQHAHNPVNWYPWSDEAFEKAHTENKPIFLSIGYSTCHWCHVMERESFEDEEVAAILNENYISIKVDREERPDIDSIYMSYCHATGVHGGWPLSVFLTAEKTPFYVGTYFPPKSRYGITGFIDLLNTIQNKWNHNQKSLETYAKQISEDLQAMNEKQQIEDIHLTAIHEAYHYFDHNFDPVYGGFGKAPKFPSPHNLLFLLRYYHQFNQERAYEMVDKTLEQMAKGGIFDHLGGGFSRYSTDAKWLAPHFEKMLYDNALLLIAYTECYLISRKEVFKDVAEQIVHYVLRDMTSIEGGFYCAEDADSEGVEGKYYLWTLEEIEEVLGKVDSKLFCHVYGVSEKGNFEGENILNRIQIGFEEYPEIEDMTQKLFARRRLRVPPYKDDKILTGWNGLMIAALSMASQVFGRKKYLESAKKAFSFIQLKLVGEGGRLYARYRSGERKHLAYLDDYAFLIWAAIELYEASFDLEYLSQAISLTEQMKELFLDGDSKGFFLYGKDGEQLFLKPKEIVDGAIPSGNSVAIYNLLRLSRLTGNSEYEELALRLLHYFGSQVNRSPMAHSFMLIAKLFEQGKGMEIVLAGNRRDNQMIKMMEWPREYFKPFAVTILNSNPTELAAINSFAANQFTIDGKTTAYICEGMSCRQPLTEVKEFYSQLEKR